MGLGFVQPVFYPLPPMAFIPANTTQLLLRHADRFPERLLVIDPPDAESIGLLQRPGRQFLVRDFSVYGNAPREAVCHFEAWFDSGPSRFEGAILFLPKGKDALAMALAMASAALPPQGTLWLVGGNKEGIRSAVRLLEQVVGPATKVESARHCSLFAARSEQHSPGGVDGWIGRWPLEVEGVSLEIVSLPGVFSHGRLDDGTRHLLAALRAPSQGRVLDLGCGAGVIGAYIARICPRCRVEMVDASAMAVAASRRTVEANGLENAAVYPSDVFSQVEGMFDYIVSNPPFHSHVRTDYRVHQELVAGAARHLAPSGRLQVVVNRFLKVEALLDAHFEQVGVDFEDSRFRVYSASRARR